MEKAITEIEDNQLYTELDFSEIDLEGRELKGCKFIHCSFRSARMESIITLRCSFSDCDFKAVRLNASMHEGSAFTNCQFIYTNFFTTQLKSVKCLARPSLMRVFSG